MATRLILIRHGQTDWNLKRKYSGFVNVRLNQTGKKQAQKLGGRLKDGKFDKIYSSDRKRALETARIVFKSRKIEVVPDLRELHFGIFEGLTYKVIMKKHPEIYKRWLDDPYSVTIPKGEALKDFKKRIVAAFKKIISLNNGKCVAAVCHGGVISIFINYISGSEEFWKQIPGAASLSIIECINGRKKIKLFNDVKHLNG